MNDAPTPGPDDEDGEETYRDRHDKYRRREIIALSLLAGLGGVVALMVGDLTASLVEASPLRLQRALLTLLGLTAVLLAFSWIGFEWAATTIERRTKSGRIDWDKVNKEPWPTLPERCYHFGLWAFVGLLFAFFVSVWWPDLAQVIARIKGQF